MVDGQGFRVEHEGDLIQRASGHVCAVDSEHNVSDLDVAAFRRGAILRELCGTC